MADWQFWRRETRDRPKTSAAATKPEEVFWQWFETNEARLFDFEEEQRTLFAELTPRIRAVHQNLAFAFGSKRDGRREFVVSAEGIREAFPAVSLLVKAAPPLRRWSIVAFRPRVGPATINFQGHELAPEETFFIATMQNGRADLTLFVPDRLCGKGQMHQALCFLMLDNILGEYDVATKIGAIAVQPLSRTADARRSPIADLPQMVDRLEARN
jgi:hypothetical protein